MLKGGDVLKCPNCGSEESRILDSRFQDGGKWRRRECRDCGVRFATLETIGARPKEAQTTQAERDRLLAGLCLALSESTVSRQRLRAVVGDKIMDRLDRWREGANRD